MRIPKKVKIGAYNYTVVYKDDLREDGHSVWGLCDANNNKIYLKKGMTGRRKLEVFIHEALHAIEDSYGVSLGEKKVNVLGLAIMALFTENKLHV